MTEEEMVDTGVIAEVPANERSARDEGDGSNALEGGDDTDAADKAAANPGEPVDLEEVE